MNDFLPGLFGIGGVVLGTLIPFLFVLTVVVFVHEMGHYLVGRLCGIGVRAFSVGFGPELVGFTDRHGTRWKLCAIPLGGYVKFVGDMNATSSQPGSEEIEKLTDDERKVAFHTQPIWKRAATVFAGPLFNFLLTIVVFAVLFLSFGRYVLEPTVAEVRPNSPAAVAGILPGDRFVSVDGEKVETFSDVQRLVSGRAGDAMTFVMLRDGKNVTVVATPQLSEEKDALGNKVKMAVIGVGNNAEVGQPRLITYSPGGAVVAAVEATGQIVERTGLFMKRFVVGREDKCQLGGPGGQTRLRMARATCRVAIGRYRDTQSLADSAPRRRPSSLLWDRGRHPEAGVGADDGSGLSNGDDSGFGVYGVRFLERSLWVLKS